MTITTNSTRTCCGVFEIGNLGYNHLMQPHVPSHTEAELLEQLASKEVYPGNMQGLALIMINNHQVPVLDPILRKAGYKCVAQDAFHPGHGNTITVYLKAMHPSRSPNLRLLSRRRTS